MWVGMYVGMYVCAYIRMYICVCMYECMCVYNLNLCKYKDDLEVQKILTLCLITQDIDGYLEAIIQLVPQKDECLNCSGECVTHYTNTY
jgi:hypothetical protein